MELSPDQISAAITALRELGASEVYLFGSAARHQFTSGSDLDLAVQGVPAGRIFTAVSRASDAAGVEVDLVDLGDDTPLVRYLRKSGDLVRVF